MFGLNHCCYYLAGLKVGTVIKINNSRQFMTSRFWQQDALLSIIQQLACLKGY